MIDKPSAASTEDRERRHGLRNQINAISMNAELIGLLAANRDYERIGECAQRISDACRQAAELLEP